MSSIQKPIRLWSACQFFLRPVKGVYLVALWLCLSLSACQNLFLTPTPVSRDYFYPPEYTQTQALIVSEHLATFPGGPQLLSALLELGSEVWMLSSVQENAEITRNFLAERFGLAEDMMTQLKVIPAQTQTVWARDWAPLFVSHAETARMGLVDLDYYPDRPIDDAVPQTLISQIQQIQGQAQNASSSSQLDYLPIALELEGGNVMCTRRNCFVTEEVIERQLMRSGSHESAEAIQDKLEAYLDQEFWIVPRMPQEGTGHIDIWAKFLNEKTLIIGEISDAALDRVPEEQARFYARVKQFLDEQATGYDAAGQALPSSLAARIQTLEPEIEIVRIPMPTPGVYRGVETFRTYTNSILLGNRAIVPRYLSGARNDFNGRAQSLADEERVAAIYAAAGYEVLWLRADRLIRDGGAWHCVTMQVPQSAIGHLRPG